MGRAVTWSQYRESIGDRSELFDAVAGLTGARRALYPGSYVDLAPSTALESVTYVDTDRRAAAFFADRPGVEAELAGRTRPGAGQEVRFIDADYTRPLDVPEASSDLIISLFAGPVWDHTARYLRPGGWLLANTSHGDASLAALDPSLRLVAVAAAYGDGYRLGTEGIADYLVPARTETAVPDLIRSSGRGITYTRSAFAYLFQRV